MESTLDKLDKFYRIYGKYRYEIYLFIISALAFIVHIHLASTLNLGNDEAHYYIWSLKPSLGYLDDAPLVSYVIYFFTGLFGKSQLTVRLGAVIFSYLDGFLIYYLTYLLFKNKRASFYAFLFFLSTIIFGMVLSVIILPDAPLLFFYLCFLIVFYKACSANNPLLEKEECPQAVNAFSSRIIANPLLKKEGCPQGGVVATPLFLWLLAGVFLGLAFLSKYTAALIPPSVLLYLAVSKKNRGLLKTFYPYAALGIALLIFSPVIYWNWTHNFVSFKFQLSHGFSHPKPGLPLFITGWFGQFLVITPFIYIFLIGTFLYSLKFILKLNKSDAFLSNRIIANPLLFKEGCPQGGVVAEGFLYSVCLSLPILLFFILNGYYHRILVHWPDIGYLPALPVMGYIADLLTAPASGGSRSGNAGLSSRLWRPFVKYYIYFSIFFGFFLFFVLYNQIYYNSIPVGKIIKYTDEQKRLKKGGIFSLIPDIHGNPSTADITNDLFGWRRSAKYIGIIFNGYETAYHPLFILTHHYAIADELAYYGGYKPAVNIYNISGFLNQYDLWQNLNKINGKNALFVMDNKYMLNPVQKYAGYFKSIKKIGRLDIYVGFKPVRVYYLYLMKDFNAKKAIKRLTAESRMY